MTRLDGAASEVAVLRAQSCIRVASVPPHRVPMPNIRMSATASLRGHLISLPNLGCLGREQQPAMVVQPRRFSAVRRT
jgi:hypothetical protein